MQRVRIVTAEERLSAANNKTSLAIFGLPGVGKTTLLKTLPADKTVCLDLEAGMKSVQDWPGASIPVRSFGDFRDLAVLIGGADPAADPNAYYSERHYQHVRSVYAGSGLEEFLAAKPIIFVDCITDLTRQAMVVRQAAAGGVLRAHRQAGCARRLRPARPRGDPGAEAPAACPGQDGDLRRRAGEGHRRVQRRHLAAADGGLARPAASCPASSTR